MATHVHRYDVAIHRSHYIPHTESRGLVRSAPHHDLSDPEETTLVLAHAHTDAAFTVVACV